MNKNKDECPTVIETHCNRIAKSHLFICKFASNPFILWLPIRYLKYFDNRMHFRYSDFFRRKQKLIKYALNVLHDAHNLWFHSYYKICGG